MSEAVDLLKARPICEADIRLAGGTQAIGRSPWRNRRVSYIGGGTLRGERLRGEVLAGGADWSEGGEGPDGAAYTLIDVRSTWRTHDGALIHVAYHGRLIIPADVLEPFRDPAQVEQVPPDRYYFRINPTFETGDPRYGWLNAVVAVGYGHRTAEGVRYRIYELL